MQSNPIDENIYQDGRYLSRTGGTWHLEDSQFKATQVAEMLRKHPDIGVKSICEVGCGAGGILAELQRSLPEDTLFTGYEVSPQAYEISRRFTNEKCRFIMGDAFADSVQYDMVLVMDVVEHVEDCFGFLRKCRNKGATKLYHIPLDAHVSAILRGSNAWDSVGHIHLFTVETALRAIEYTGHKIIDWTLTPGALAKTVKSPGTRAANVVRTAISGISTKVAARLVGGYSILILAQ